MPEQAGRPLRFGRAMGTDIYVPVLLTNKKTRIFREYAQSLPSKIQQG